MPGSYLDLVAAIIRSGLKHEGPDYLLTLGGRYWCVMGNLDPEVVRKLAIRHHPVGGSEGPGYAAAGPLVEEESVSALRDPQ